MGWSAGAGNGQPSTYQPCIRCDGLVMTQGGTTPEHTFERECIRSIADRMKASTSQGGEAQKKEK